ILPRISLAARKEDVAQAPGIACSACAIHDRTRCAASLSLMAPTRMWSRRPRQAIAGAAHVLFRQTLPGDRSPGKVAKDVAAQDVSRVVAEYSIAGRCWSGR